MLMVIKTDLTGQDTQSHIDSNNKLFPHQTAVNVVKMFLLMWCQCHRYQHTLQFSTKTPTRPDVQLKHTAKFLYN